MSSRYAIDSIALRDGLVFGWGWFLHDDAPAQHLQLVIHHRSGAQSILGCTRGGSRVDVAAAHPEVPHAGSAGFIIQGRVHGDWNGARSELRAQLADGRQLTQSIEGFPFRFMPAAANTESLKAKGAAALALVRNGDVGGFLARIGRLLADLWRRVRTPVAPTEKPAMHRFTVVFDHAMGGGANRFREQRVAELIADGCCVATVLPDLPQLQYRLRIADRERAHETSASLTAALAELDRQQIAAIEINDLVSFDDPLAVVVWATAHAKRGVVLRMYVHDFHAVCPSWTLIDHRERYCGVPSLDVCASCLRQLDIPFLALLPPTDIPRWRTAWLRLLQCASEIIAFSPASVQIVLRAFPQLDPARIRVQPHVVDYLDASPLQPDLSLPLRIGVVGNISRHKGSQIVWDLAELIAARGLPIQIVVIGTIEDQVHSEIVQVTGQFRAESLPQLLGEHGVGICLLPSICPETFSYVTAELMQLQMPLAVFDLGAPAERVIDYPAGRVIADTTAQCALETILELHRSLLRDAASIPVSHDA